MAVLSWRGGACLELMSPFAMATSAIMNVLQETSPGHLKGLHVMARSDNSAGNGRNVFNIQRVQP